MNTFSMGVDSLGLYVSSVISRLNNFKLLQLLLRTSPDDDDKESLEQVNIFLCHTVTDAVRSTYVQ